MAEKPLLILGAAAVGAVGLIYVLDNTVLKPPTFNYKGQAISYSRYHDKSIRQSDVFFTWDPRHLPDYKGSKKIQVELDEEQIWKTIIVEEAVHDTGPRMPRMIRLVTMRNPDADNHPNSIEEEYVAEVGMNYLPPIHFSLSGAARPDLSMGNIDFSDPSKNIWSGDIKYAESFLRRYKNLSDQYIEIVGALQDSLHGKMHGGSGVSNQNLENRERQKSFGGKQNSIFKQQSLRAMGNGSRRFR